MKVGSGMINREVEQFDWFGLGGFGKDCCLVAVFAALILILASFDC